MLSARQESVTWRLHNLTQPYTTLHNLTQHLHNSVRLPTKTPPRPASAPRAAWGRSVCRRAAPRSRRPGRCTVHRRVHRPANRQRAAHRPEASKRRRQARARPPAGARTAANGPQAYSQATTATTATRTKKTRPQSRLRQSEPKVQSGRYTARSRAPRPVTTRPPAASTASLRHRARSTPARRQRTSSWLRLRMRLNPFSPQRRTLLCPAWW